MKNEKKFNDFVKVIKGSKKKPQLESESCVCEIEKSDTLLVETEKKNEKTDFCNFSLTDCFFYYSSCMEEISSTWRKEIKTIFVFFAFSFLIFSPNLCF